MDIRRIALHGEELLADAGGPLERPIHRAAGMAVLLNPYAGRLEEDLSPLFEVGYEIGTMLMGRVVGLLGGPPVSYGKAAVVGTLGEVEHGAALIHPKLGKAMREAMGGGEAIIPSNAKVAAPGTLLDVPLGHKDDLWSFDHFDTITVMLADAPRPDEIVLVMAAADGGRPRPRVGRGRLV